MAPPEPLTIGTQAVLLDVLETLKRLESGLCGQDRRLYLVEQRIRSGSLSPVTHPDRHGDIFSLASGRDASERTQSPATTPPLSPALLYRESVDEVRRKFEYRKADDEEAVGPHGADLRGTSQGLDPEQDAASTSVYSRQPSHLDLKAVVTNPPPPPPIPPRSRSRHQSAEAAGVSRFADMVTVAYEGVTCGPVPSRVRPSEAYFGTTKQRKSRGIVGLVINVFTPKRGLAAMVSHVSGQNREGQTTAVPPKMKKEDQVQSSFVGWKGFWRSLVVVLTTTHRSRPYIVA